MICQNSEEASAANLLIDSRQYENIVNGGLKVPNALFVKITKTIVDIFTDNFDKFCFKKEVLQNLFGMCNSIKVACTDDLHRDIIIRHILKVLIRAKIKIINAKAKNAKKKLKKFDIINHL